MKIETVTSIKKLKGFCIDNFTDKCPFINYDFFELLENTNCTVGDKGWIPEHILIKKKRRVSYRTLENSILVNLSLTKFLKMHSIN